MTGSIEETLERSIIDREVSPGTECLTLENGLGNSPDKRIQLKVVSGEDRAYSSP